MNYQFAKQQYTKQQTTMINSVETVILLLKQVERGISQLHTAIRLENTREIERILRDLQTILFELMALTDRTHEKGKRLFLSYAYINQQFVTMRLTHLFDELAASQLLVEQLRQSWEEALANQRKKMYTTDQI